MHLVKSSPDDVHYRDIIKVGLLDMSGRTSAAKGANPHCNAWIFVAIQKVDILASF